MNEMPGGQLKNRLEAKSATPSELFPVFAKRKELVSKGFLGPVAVTFAFVLALTASSGEPAMFRNIFGVFLGVGCYFVIYLLCGKSKPWYVLAGATVFTAALMLSPLFHLFFLVFYDLLGTPQGEKVLALSFPRQILARFLSTGGMEEFVKIIPVLIVWKYTSKLQSPKREKIGVTEPLDGILIAAASALGFVFVETLIQYAPNAVTGVASNIGRKLPGLPPELLMLAGDVFGLQSVIYRILPELSGHLAYSAYFGYFVGLAAMKPKHAWKLVLIGYACASGLHAIWDLFCDMPGIGLYLQLPMMLVFFAFMAAAILKARQISPMRAQNFATVVIQSPAVAAAGMAVEAAVGIAAQPVQVQQPRPVAAPAPVLVVAPKPVPVAAPVVQAPVVQAPVVQAQVIAPVQPIDSGLKLRIGKRALALRDGDRFAETDIPGLRALAADGIVASVNRNPKDPGMIGLQNMSDKTWKVALPTGEAREIAAGRSVRLMAATRIDFGLVKGEVA